jgi:Nuclease-related domain
VDKSVSTHAGVTARHSTPSADYTLEVTVFIAIIVALIIGFVLGRYKTYVFQNRSEARLSRALKMQFVAPDYHLLNHVTLRVEDGTTQIDHVLVSRFGIFVIETKDYKGWIFAGPHDRYWTQVPYRAKFIFQNPLRQNHRHVRAIQELLNFLPADAVRPAVVFTGDAEFKTNIPDGVFTVAGFMAFVEGTTQEVMSVNRVQFCVGRLETTRLSITKATDVEHVEGLRRRFGNDE